MNKLSKSLIVIFLTFLFGSCFSVCFVQAQSNDLILETIKECKIQYTGDSCVAELKLNNNAGEVLDGTAFLSIDYRGVCGDGLFDGEGIGAQFSINNGNWLDFSNWDVGTATFSDFDITKGETQPKLKIETIPNLCPGKYSFIFTLKGTAETGEEYTTIPAIIGGGGEEGEEEAYYEEPVSTEEESSREVAGETTRREEWLIGTEEGAEITPGEIISPSAIEDEEVVGLKEATTFEEESPQKDLFPVLATMGMAWGEITHSTILMLILILCLIVLIIIGIRERRRRARRKKKEEY